MVFIWFCRLSNAPFTHTHTIYTHEYFIFSTRALLILKLQHWTNKTLQAVLCRKQLQNRFIKFNIWKIESARLNPTVYISNAYTSSAIKMIVLLCCYNVSKYHVCFSPFYRLSLYLAVYSRMFRKRLASHNYRSLFMYIFWPSVYLHKAKRGADPKRNHRFAPKNSTVSLIVYFYFSRSILSNYNAAVYNLRGCPLTGFLRGSCKCTNPGEVW